MKSLNAVTLGVLIALGGCATSGQGMSSRPSQEDLVRLQTMPTAVAINEAETYIKRSREKELDFLTPQHYSLATQAIDEAKTMLEHNQPSANIVQKVAVAEAMLKDSERVARTIKSSLSDELSMKDDLEQLKAPDIYKSEYGSLVARLNDIIRQVEEGKKADSIDERKQLIAEMSHLQAKSIKYNALNEPKEILKRVKYRGGPELAPLTYNEAVEVYNKAEQFITKNPHMREAVEQLSQEALFAAKRALYITQEVAALSSKMSLSMEQVVLDEEYRLHRVARALTDKDVRDNPLEVQSELLAASVGEVVSHSQKQDDLIIAMRDTLIKVRDASTPSVLNGKIKTLKKENGELVAKNALFSAKVSQLQAELRAKDSDMLLLGEQLDRATRALNMSEMENKALNISKQQSKAPNSDQNVSQSAEVTAVQGSETPEQKVGEVEVSSFETSSEQIRDDEQKTAEQAPAPSTKNEELSASNQKPVEEQSVKQAVVASETVEKTKEKNTEELAKHTDKGNKGSIVDKSTASIISDLLAEPQDKETTTIAVAPIQDNTSEQALVPSRKQELNPEEAFAAGN